MRGSLGVRLLALGAIALGPTMLYWMVVWFVVAERDLHVEVVGGAAAVLVASAVAFSYGAERLVMRPLRALVEASERVAAGGVSIRAHTSAYKGEFGDLAESFNELAFVIESRTRELMHSEQRYRAMVDLSPYGIVVTTGDGVIDYANLVAARLFGSDDVAGLAGREIVDLLQPDDREAVEVMLASVVETGIAGAPIEVEAPREGGGSAVVRLVASPLVERDGRRVVQVLIGDVTAEREAERAMKAAEERTAQLQKMDAIARLAGGIAHDFNNLFTAVQGFTSLARSAVGSGRDPGDELDEIEAAASQAAELTRQLLAFARRQDLNLEPVDLNRVVGDTERLAESLLGDQVTLRTELAPGLWTVNADPAQMQQVIMDLLISASDAMAGRSGEVVIRTGNVTLDEQAVAGHAGVRPGPHVALSVTDNGRGMDPEVAARVFEPFYAGDEAGRHAGLSLPTVYGVVHHTGGYVDVSSRPGEGSTFTLYLPQATEAVATVSPEPPPVENIATSARSVLLVEDEPQVRRFTERVLSGLGYIVTTAGSGDEALSLASMQPGPVSLLIADVSLPDIDGGELARRLTERWPQLSVLYMSGFDRDTIVAEGRLEPGAELLEKPFAPDELARRVATLLVE